MSRRYKGAVISATPPTTTGGISGTAPGAWTLQQQMQAQAAGTWPAQPIWYVENVFSPYLYTGTGASLTITNSINTSTYGGMVWLKRRNGAANHQLYDTARGATQALSSNGTAGSTTVAQGLTAFGTTGFTLGTDTTANTAGNTYASWTFRKQPKFFDIVTWTGNSTNRDISHNLGAVPGCILVKKTGGTATVEDWQVYHRSLANTQYMVLNSTGAVATGADRWNSTTPTSTTFRLGTATTVNETGNTYVAYLFAHDAGGFGLTGSDNVISCGSYTGNGSATGPTVTLGYEPQFILFKKSSAAGDDWQLYDNMRGLATGPAGGDSGLFPNTTATEDYGATIICATATGFQLESSASAVNASGATYIYIAVRRGIMQVPTDGTTVFSPNLATSTEGVGTIKTTNFPVDAQFTKTTTSGGSFYSVDRLRGISTNTTDGANILVTNTTAAESSSAITRYWSNTNFQISSAIGNSDQMYWNFRRAPGFFDQVCYTGTGAVQNISHNLGVAPEFMIVRRRDAIENWFTYSAALGATKRGPALDSGTDGGNTGSGYWNNTAPTASVFTVGTDTGTNYPAGTFIAHLFATCPGVSKVGSYTGTGTLTTIDCGFTGGARFVLIRRTGAGSNWYIWDTTRGMVAGTDPALWFNATTAAQANNNSVYTTATGFQLLASPFADVNTNGASYIYLAIA